MNAYPAKYCRDASEPARVTQRRRALAMLALGFCLALTSGTVLAAEGLRGALEAGSPIVDLRLRYEGVDQGGKPSDATAQTIRARLGYRTGEFLGVSALAEFDAVSHFGPERFNNSINGRTAYPLIADPDMVALNRLQLGYGLRLTDKAEPDITFILGRQRLAFGNGRFIGSAEWRQHEQSFDALSLVSAPLTGTTLSYSYVTRVNRVFGPDSSAGTFDSHSHFFNAVNSGLLPQWKLEAYAYLLDLRQAPTLSTSTVGARAEGSFDLGSGTALKFNTAYARQNDYGRNPLAIGLSYLLGEAGFASGGLTGVVGYEGFEGNGAMGFQTPLANLHPFQGWAETFLTKPANGLKDFYARGGYGFAAAPLFARVSGALAYHDFSAERGGADLGTEWDAQLEGQIDSHLAVDVAYANFSGKGPFPDKRVLFLYSTYRY